MDINTVCCTLFLLTCTGVCFGQELILPEGINKAVGENVVITPISIPEQPHLFIRWMFNKDTILSGPPDGITLQPQYTDRVNLDTSTLALEIRSLTESDTGSYSLFVDTVDKRLTSVTSLQVLGVCFGQELILPEGINKAVGENVVITPISIPEQPHLFIRWMFKKDTILSGPPDEITLQPQYTDRVNLDTSTLALEIRSLTESDTGSYSLFVDTVDKRLTSVTSLQVLVPASNVVIVPSNTELLEFNSTVSLVCSASGSSPSFIWLNGSSEVTAGERVQLTNSNSNLTITSVIRGDTGPYQCEASNSFSNAKSPQLSLTIYYGPENVRVVAAPVGPSYSSGSNLILTCSADSSPAAEFQWAVNGIELGKIGQELKLSNIQSSHSGSYTCMAHNKQSLRYSTSEPISITVLEEQSPE
ncbi:cell adhesion molecule CEACAM8-like isoform 2-T2 [Clarias gariepinus]